MRTTTSDGDGPTSDSPGSPYSGARLGIAFSGGGIRSAAFCLGVYQCLDQERIFQRARYLAGVSGGAYIASGLAIGHARVDEQQYAEGKRPWARRSQEEQYLSRNLSYLAPEGSGRIWLLANLAYGLVMNVLPLIAGAVLAGRLLGLGYRELVPGIGTPGSTEPALVALSAAACAVLAVLALVAVASRRFRDREGVEPPRNELNRHERFASLAIGLAVAVLAFGVLLPLVIVAISSGPAWLVPAAEPDGYEWALRRIGLGLALTLAFGALGALAVSFLSRGRFPKARTALAWVSGPGILLVPLILSAQSEAALGWRGGRDILVIGGLAALLACFGIVAHNRRYSMHLYYRERLHDAFCLMRSDDGKVTPIPYADAIYFTDIARNLTRRREDDRIRFPELIVCAAVAARGRWAPHKARALSFTFEGTRSRIDDGRDSWASTTELERKKWLRGSELTLPSLMAISGAALSPLMGRFTLPAFRFLMAVLNVRLGVWIENPWHRGAGRGARLDRWARSSDRWATSSQEGAGNAVRRAIARLWLGWREPGPWFVLKEGLGRADATGRFLYVSDGGHWENLGLVELLRRGCTHVICVNASGSAVGDFGRAAAIARRDLGAEVDIAPGMLEVGDDGLVDDPVAVGTIRYEGGREGQIYVARCALWSEAPADLLILSRSGSVFPNHPTTKQFLSGEEFEAYRALGWSVASRLVEVARLPPEEFDEALEDREAADRERQPRATRLVK